MSYSQPFSTFLRVTKRLTTSKRRLFFVDIINKDGEKKNFYETFNH